MTGFILLSRDLLENDIWGMNSDLVRLWIYLLLKANYGKKEFTYSRGTTKVTVKKGEFLRSLRRISDDCSYTGNNRLVSWSTSRIAAMLKTLEDDGRIEILSNSTLGTHLRLSNYEAYQSFAAYKRDRLRTDAEQMQHKSKAVESNKEQTDALWDVWLEELSPKPPHPRLTEKRRSALMSLYTEQLSKNGSDPLVLFRKVMRAVKGSSHHMKTRSYQLPESLFRSEERRESWTHRALTKVKGDPKSATVSRKWSVEQ